ncbi:triose-phosphate isomerase [Thiotrichales bacterium 19S11-10]|nr:triose-phosphate isomerase [Thiotrichales bacterium 19S11-10]MCF6806964.1 triose-phosphate isomerase [Thiotrichales bacterium 19S9-11]MCF6810933.1 triose-phosphate isomerase [Thiotrichales bacterium 19S9-12]
MRKPLVMGNWKSFGSLAFSKNLCESLSQVQTDKVEVVLFIPYPFLNYTLPLVLAKGIALGAQNVSAYNEGAYTGEVSASMLSNIGCQYVLIGHSERRSLFNEDDDMIRQKVKCALESNLSIVLCVGETKKERLNHEHESVVEKQILSAISNLNDKELEKIVIAYEPVWAIGTGLAATEKDVDSMHRFIRSVIEKISQPLAKQLRIVYGGSVKPNNASGLFGLLDVDGGLIGGASLDANSFEEIIKMAQ